MQLPRVIILFIDGVFDWHIVMECWACVTFARDTRVIYICVCTCLYVCMYVCVCAVYILIYIYMCIHTHTHTRIIYIGAEYIVDWRI